MLYRFRELVSQSAAHMIFLSYPFHSIEKPKTVKILIELKLRELMMYVSWCYTSKIVILVKLTYADFLEVYFSRKKRTSLMSPDFVSSIFSWNQSYLLLWEIWDLHSAYYPGSRTIILPQIFQFAVYFCPSCFLYLFSLFSDVAPRLGPSVRISIQLNMKPLSHR